VTTDPAPAVSVVMPVWNATATVAAAIASVVDQTERDWELVAVDDGSIDGSIELLRAFAARDARIRVVAQAHRGLVAALETGLHAARAPLIARLDADDVARPERLERQRAHLDAHPDVGLVATCVTFDGDRTRSAGYARYVDWTNTLLTHDAIALAAFVESPLAHPSVMFRRALVERFGGYASGDFPEDYELWLRWLDGGVRMDKLAEPLLVWRDSPGRLSRRDPRYASEAFYRVKATYLARWLARHNPHHPSVIVWGAGRVTRRRARHLTENGVRVNACVDIDPRKIGARLGTIRVLAPDGLPPAGQAFVVSYVASRDARASIETDLRSRGYRPGVDYVLAA
jgi:glycosyltransferase involved in cell wall biosynthesis